MSLISSLAVQVGVGLDVGLFLAKSFEGDTIRRRFMTYETGAADDLVIFT